MADPRKVLAERKAQILEQAQRQAAEIDKDLEQLERLTAKYNLQVVEATTSPAVAAPAATAPQRQALPWERPIDPSVSITKASISIAEGMIQSAGRPVPLGTIFNELDKKGITFKSKEPRSTLSAVLGQSGRLVSIKGVGWWIKDKPLPAERDIFKEGA
ncbi:hypothetical protein ACSHT2_25560 [Bradyrhizobium sp. PUT101]|uniref:hypothetical protein n=1 Tax=unclassified Bradyrhizobium TaxID=2631580 RepID=UPI001EF94EEF|nr:hypothetical protein [Bradyrhizobium sp. I71]ULK95644.1 hypothetical protein FJV43_23010 [Bradyrhizobium sp. I71]